MGESYVHQVCTRDEARALLDAHGGPRFWVSNCGCRQGRGRCAHSRHDVCLALDAVAASGGKGLHEVDRAGVEEILHEAEARHLVPRPFYGEGRTRLAGFCFCCPDCCAYFQDPTVEPCAKGVSVERTDRDLCTDCGDCAGVCYFGARRLVDGALVVDHTACYGCGLCADVCPEECITLVPRASTEEWVGGE